MLKGTISMPGDKSISHRAIMLNSISHGKAQITNLLLSEDSLATIKIMQNLGVEIKLDEKTKSAIVKGSGFSGLKPSKGILDCQNSGTTARLLLGLLAGLPFSSTLTGDESLNKRPMYRVVKQLEKLNGVVNLTNDNFLPATIQSSKLVSKEVFLDVASAQVKSAVILAALKCDGETIIHEKQATRNHTELMLKYLGADIHSSGLTIKVYGNKPLQAKDIIVPGDISSAAFFIVAALINPASEITIKNCGLNPTRTGILKVLIQSGANISINNERTIANEKIGDICVKYSPNMTPLIIEEDIVPSLIDEIPILALLATQIKGESCITGASELRVKETDRIKAVTQELTKLGANITELPDGLIIKGKTKLVPHHVNSYGDHRMSMMLKVAQTITGDFQITQADCDRISYPNFSQDLETLLK